MKKLFIFMLLLPSLLVGCSNNNPTQQETGSMEINVNWPDETIPVQFETITEDLGTLPFITSQVPKTFIIKNYKSLYNFQTTYFQPPYQSLDIDFESEMLIAILWGSGNYCGSSPAVNAIREILVNVSSGNEIMIVEVDNPPLIEFGLTEICPVQVVKVLRYDYFVRWVGLPFTPIEGEIIPPQEIGLKGEIIPPQEIALRNNIR